MSGGGVRNLTRLAPRARFLLDSWPEPVGLFPWLAELGGIEPREMYQTFNMGIGFVLVVRPRGVAEVLRRLARHGGADAVPLGRVERGTVVELPGPGLRYQGYA